MRSRVILVLAAAGIIAVACASTAATPAPSIAPAPAAALATPADTPVPEPAPAASPTPTPVPPTDGEGDEVVSGILELPALEHSYTTETVNGVTQYRGGIVRMTQTMNDPRVTGLVRFEFAMDAYTTAASEWGTFTLLNEAGTWTGTCTGGSWMEGDGVAWGCWLVGSRGYEGYTFFQAVVKELGQAPVVHGVIYEGAPPAV